MTFLHKLITRLSGFGRSKTGTGCQQAADAGGERTRFDAMWDEALVASLHCEAARMFLDLMGPRWK